MKATMQTWTKMTLRPMPATRIFWNRHRMPTIYYHTCIYHFVSTYSVVFISSTSTSTTSTSTSTSVERSSTVCAGGNSKQVTEERIAIPRILFFGGDIVSHIALSALYNRMYCIASSVFAHNESKHDYEFMDESYKIDTNFRKNEEESYEIGESTMKYNLAEEIVRKHLTVICPSLPPSTTSVAEVAQKFKRQYPVLRFCAEKQINVFPVDHPKSFVKSKLYKYMLNSVQVNHNHESKLPVNMNNTCIVQDKTACQSICKLQEREQHEEDEEQIKKYNKLFDLTQYDLAVIVSFRYFLPNALLMALPRTINVHPSLLPRYRGASPILSTLLHNEERGGVSIIKLTPYQTLMDSGDVLCQESITIPPSMDAREYFPLVTQTAASALCNVIFGNITNDKHAVGSKWSKNATCDWPSTFDKLWNSATSQTHSNYQHFRDDPFYAPLLPKHAAAMQFDKQTDLEIYGVWRAFVGYDYFSASSNALFDKLATPVGSQLLSRIMHKKERESIRCRKHEKLQTQRKDTEEEKEEDDDVVSLCEESVSNNWKTKSTVKETLHSCGTEFMEHHKSNNTHNVRMTIVEPEITLLSSMPMELCETCSFVQAVHPKNVSPNVIEEMKTLESKDEHHIIAQDWLKINSTNEAAKSVPITSVTSNVAKNTESSSLGNFSLHVNRKESQEDCKVTVEKIEPGMCYFPVADEQIGAIKCATGWFYWSTLHLKCAARPQKAQLLRQGLAMKTGVLYRNVFRSIQV